MVVYMGARNHQQDLLMATTDLSEVPKSLDGVDELNGWVRDPENKYNGINFVSRNGELHFQMMESLGDVIYLVVRHEKLRGLKGTLRLPGDGGEAYAAEWMATHNPETYVHEKLEARLLNTPDGWEMTSHSKEAKGETIRFESSHETESGETPCLYVDGDPSRTNKPNHSVVALVDCDEHYLERVCFPDVPEGELERDVAIDNAFEMMEEYNSTGKWQVSEFEELII